MCTIAGAKVQLNHNCYNVYFNECLLTTCSLSNAYKHRKNRYKQFAPATPSRVTRADYTYK